MVMNIGAGVSTSINEILRLAAEICGVDYDPVHLPPRPGDIRDSRADISQAERLLGYRPAISLREGLALTMASLRA